MKIFGIGLSRTGTHSLVAALRRLGYKAIHFPKDLRVFDGDMDAGADLSVVANYKMLDAKYPGSKFIYTVRDEVTWMASCRKQWEVAPPVFGRRSYEYCCAVYGTPPDYNPAVFAKVRRVLERDIIQHFAGRGQDVLILNICEGADASLWSALGLFLGKDVKHLLDEPFPCIDPREIKT